MCSGQLWGSRGYSGFHTSCRPITGWAHTPIIVARSRINSREDVGGRARGQSHSSHKQSSQSLLITPGMYVTSSTGFHCCLHFRLAHPPLHSLLSLSSLILYSYSSLQPLIVSPALTYGSPLSPCLCLLMSPPPVFWLIAVMFPGSLCLSPLYCSHLSLPFTLLLCLVSRTQIFIPMGTILNLHY